MVRLCVELFGSAEARVPSFLCVASVPCLVCGEPALLLGAVVPNRHYSGAALNSAGPALLRALSVPRDRHYTRSWHYSTGTKEAPALYYYYYD